MAKDLKSAGIKPPTSLRIADKASGALLASGHFIHNLIGKLLKGEENLFWKGNVQKNAFELAQRLPQTICEKGVLEHAMTLLSRTDRAACVALENRIEKYVLEAQRKNPNRTPGREEALEAALVLAYVDHVNTWETTNCTTIIDFCKWLIEKPGRLFVSICIRNRGEGHCVLVYAIGIRSGKGFAIVACNTNEGKTCEEFDLIDGAMIEADEVHCEVDTMTQHALVKDILREYISDSALHKLDEKTWSELRNTEETLCYSHGTRTRAEARGDLCRATSCSTHRSDPTSIVHSICALSTGIRSFRLTHVVFSVLFGSLIESVKMCKDAEIASKADHDF